VEQGQQNRERFGAYHSSYPKVVVPSKITVVPEVRSVRSRITPDGTAMLERIIVAQDALDLLAAEAPEEPEKVHEARLERFGAAVGAGAGTAAGAAATSEVVARSPKRTESWTISTKLNE
jgi:hypothetical protein